jgi:hypothetical protein
MAAKRTPVDQQAVSLQTGHFVMRQQRPDQNSYSSDLKAPRDFAFGLELVTILQTK